MLLIYDALHTSTLMSCASSVSRAFSSSSALRFASASLTDKYLACPWRLIRSLPSTLMSRRALCDRAEALDASPTALLDCDNACSEVATALSDVPSARVAFAPESAALSPSDPMTSPDRPLVCISETSPAPIPMISKINEPLPSRCFCSWVQPAGQFVYSAMYSPRHPMPTIASDAYSAISQNKNLPR